MAISRLQARKRAIEQGIVCQSQYIALVDNEYGVSLDDIADQIGDYSSTVHRMYRGLMVIEQAEKAGVFDRKEISKPSFYFNYIYTALDYPGFNSFLGLESKTSTLHDPVPKAKVKQLGEVCEWLYGNSTRQKPSLIRSQNPDLKTLDSILTSKTGVEAPRDGFPLGVAKDISLGDEKLFRQALQQAKLELQKAHGTLVTGFLPSDSELIKLATEVDDLASDLLATMIQRRKKCGVIWTGKRPAMSSLLYVGTGDDEIVEHADWVEATTLFRADGNTSQEDLVCDQRGAWCRSGKRWRTGAGRIDNWPTAIMPAVPTTTRKYPAIHSICSTATRSCRKSRMPPAVPMPGCFTCFCWC